MAESGEAPPAYAVIGDPMNNPGDSIQRDSTIWFEDGNIVVIAQGTAFRFHKGMLSLHSQVFRDLFSIPQPSQPSSSGSAVQTFDDCPTVHVTDTNYDFRELLRAIYYGGVSHLHPEATVTFSVLAALARLSHKYQLDQLLETVVYRLQRTFTTQFDVWERSGGFDADRSPLALAPRHAIEALNLVRLLDRPEMVPVALYGCGQLGPAALLRGTTRGDGVSVERLGLADLELCLETKHRLVQTVVCLVLAMEDRVEARIPLVCSGKEGCVARKVCVDGLVRLLSSIRDVMRRGVSADVLSTQFDRDMDDWVAVGRMCGMCGSVLSAAHRKFRREAWESLPKITQLDVDRWNSA